MEETVLTPTRDVVVVDVSVVDRVPKEVIAVVVEVEDEEPSVEVVSVELVNEE